MQTHRIEQNLICREDIDRCRLDLHLPVGNPSSVLVWFHGGGLTEGDKTVGEGLGRTLAQHGIASAHANYRFSGAAKYPAYIQDAARAVSWIHRHADTYGLDQKKIFIGGISTGAYLAAMLAMNERYLRAGGPNRLEENQLFATALHNAGNERVSLKVIPGRNHNNLDTHIPEPGGPVVEAILSFLRSESL